LGKVLTATHRKKYKSTKHFTRLRTGLFLWYNRSNGKGTTLREKHRLRVFENRVLMRTFDPKSDEITGEWRRQHKEKLYDRYSSPNIIRMIKLSSMRWASNVARIGGGGVSADRVLVGKPKGKRAFVRRRRLWEGNIKMNLQEVIWRAWTGLIWLTIWSYGRML
jgi:hypothetical protein